MRIQLRQSSSSLLLLGIVRFVAFLNSIPLVVLFLIVVADRAQRGNCYTRVNPSSLFRFPRLSCDIGANYCSSSTSITNRYYYYYANNNKYCSQSVIRSPLSIKARNYISCTSTSNMNNNYSKNNNNDNKGPLSDNDAFAVFGNDDDDGDEKNSNNGSRMVRDPSNGMLMFHDGTEQALLLFVRSALSQSTTVGTQVQLNRVIGAIDQFCYERHWMMNIGPEKGSVLQEFLSESYQRYLSKSATTTDDNTYIIVELGTYCGYSLLRMVQTLLSLNNPSTKSFHIITVDVDKQAQQVAKSIIEIAGISNYVSFVLLKDDGSNETELSDSVHNIVINQLQKSKTKKIDFLFIDHEKPLYLRDLQQLEQSRLIQKGTSVAADNVYFHRINNYRQYVGSLQEQSIVTTKFVPGYLEYVIPNELQQQTSNRFTANNVPVIQDDLLHDGIELTTYLEDPIVS